MSKQAARREIDKAIANLMKYVDREPWGERRDFFFDQAFSEVADWAEVSVEDIIEEFEPNGLMPMAYGFLFETFASVLWDDDEHSLIGEYLKRRGWREGGFGRQHLVAMNESQAGLWEVLAVKPGHSVTVRQVDGLDKPIKVIERLGSQNLRKWDCIAVRMLTFGNHHRFGGSVLPIPRNKAETIVEVMEQVRQSAISAIKGKNEKSKSQHDKHWAEGMTEQDVQAEINSRMAEMLFQFWAVEAYSQLIKPAPIMMNRDNDLLEPVKMSFSFESDQRVEIIQTLNTAPDMDDTGDNTWHWLSCDVASISPETDALIWGHIVLEDTTLILEVNSQARAKRGKAYFLKLLKGIVEPGLTVHENLEQLMESQAGKSPPTPIDAPEILTPLMDQHYRKVLDENVPMLDGYTPRECAQNSDLHELLVSWLKGLENSALKSGQLSDYSFKWIWEELNLTYPD